LEGEIRKNQRWSWDVCERERRAKIGIAVCRSITYYRLTESKVGSRKLSSKGDHDLMGRGWRDETAKENT